jgi:peptidoglycan hydrolase-like protein with peptidoglycan-binding domain
MQIVSWCARPFGVVTMSKAGCLVLMFAILSAAGYAAPLDVDPDGQSARLPQQTTDIEKTPPAPPSPPLAVILTHRAGEPKVRLPVGQPPTAKATPLDRTSLTRELQRELRRVGCYGGDINGDWTQSTRRAMKAFTDRVNAILPVDQPDHILLAMVQNHQDNTCSMPCPAGEDRAPDGRCVHSSIIGIATNKPVPPPVKPAPLITGWTTTAMAPSDKDGMAIADPASRALPAAEAPKASSPTAGDVPAPRPKIAAQRRPVPSGLPSDFVRTLFQRLDRSER